MIVTTRALVQGYNRDGLRSLPKLYSAVGVGAVGSGGASAGASAPPLGIQRTPADAYGALIASRVGAPPRAIAGKNLSEVTPRSRAASISVGVATPGSTGTWQPLQCQLMSVRADEGWCKQQV